MERIKDVLPAVFKSLESPERTQKQRLIHGWAQIVGEELSKRTQPRIGSGKQLVIWVAQSTLAHEIQSKYRTAILRRAKALLGESEILDVVIRVGQLR